MTDSRTLRPVLLRGPHRGERDHPICTCPDIPSSRLHQHGVHDAALKAVRPRLRLRALRPDRDAAHTPAQPPAGTTRKRTPPTPSSYLTGPAPSWMTPPRQPAVPRCPAGPSGPDAAPGTRRRGLRAERSLAERAGAKGAASRGQPLCSRSGDPPVDVATPVGPTRSGRTRGRPACRA